MSEGWQQALVAGIVGLAMIYLARHAARLIRRFLATARGEKKTVQAVKWVKFKKGRD